MSHAEDTEVSTILSVWADRIQPLSDMR